MEQVLSLLFVNIKKLFIKKVFHLVVNYYYKNLSQPHQLIVRIYLKLIALPKKLKNLLLVVKKYEIINLIGSTEFRN